jgi:hypothetical protein
MSSDLSTAVIAGTAALLTAVVGSLITGAVNARAAAGEDLRAARLQSYPIIWRLTGLLPAWPPATITLGQLWHLQVALQKWYFQTGGYHLSENARTRYGELQQHLDKLLPGEPPDPSVELDRETYEHVRQSCSALRTALTEDLESRRARSVLSALRLRIRHSRQSFLARKRRDRASDLRPEKGRAAAREA